MEENKKTPGNIQERFEEANRALEDRYKPTSLVKKLQDAFGDNEAEQVEGTSDPVRKTEISEAKFHTYPIV